MICSRELGMDTYAPPSNTMGSGDTPHVTEDEKELNHHYRRQQLKELDFAAKMECLKYCCCRSMWGLAIGNCLDKPTERWQWPNLLCNLCCVEMKCCSYLCGWASTDDMRIVWRSCELHPCCGELCQCCYPLPYRM